jgi:universal bacterial protein YeaZ
MILCLETATPTCSVALSHQNELLAICEVNEQNSHAEKITIFIDEVMHEAGVQYSDLDAVGVSSGPGSYTGLRIGVSTAKGICYAADKPLMSIDTLHAMAYGIKDFLGSRLQKGDWLCPMIDARRMEVYSSLFDSELQCQRPTAAVILTQDSFAEVLKEHRLWLFGDGANKCHSLFDGNENVKIVDDFYPSAGFMTTLAQQNLQQNAFVDMAYYEPFYLKDFVAGKPTVKGLK